MKISELKGKTVDQLNDLLINLKKEAFNLRFQKVTGELENTSSIRRVRRDIARILTKMSQIKKAGEQGNA